MKHKLLSLFVALICASSLFASNIQVDGIWYDFNSENQTASVTYRGGSYSSYEDEYSGSVVIPETVTYNSTTYSVTTIGEYAFYACSSLTSITIPNSVTKIGEWAFRRCSSLTSVTIPNSVTIIEYGAFYDCSGLTSITIPNSVTTIGRYAFYNCYSLTSVTINSNSIISKFGDSYNNIKSIFGKQVREYIIGDSVITIGNYAFSYCDSLTSVIIGNSVTTIGESAFSFCDSLTSITIPNSVQTIGDWAFDFCSGLNSITIPNSVTTIGKSIFINCTSLTSINVDAANTHYCSMDGVLFNHVKDTLIQYPAGNTRTEYTIPNSVTTIGDYAFQRCGLTSITIPNSITTIGGSAFCYCSGLTSVTIPNSVTTIGPYAFSFCSNLTSVTIPNSVTTIGERTFEYCNGLASVIVESGNAVYDNRGNCNAIIETSTNTLILGCKNTIIPNSVTTIGVQAFAHCSSLNSITIPNSVITIGGGAFYDCSGLTSVTIPNSVTTIGEYAFQQCTSLTSVTIPNSVTTIGERAFRICSSLTSVTIPNSVTTIGEYAFQQCTSLTSVTIPNSVTTIGYEAFYGCSGLTSVTIGNSVTTIGRSAFFGCIGLTSITCYAVTPPTCGVGVFDYISQDAKVYVPASALTDYQNAEVWKDMQLYPIAADVTPMDDENPIVTPTDQDVTITWPITDGTDTYTLTITKNGEVVCVLTFDANGQLTNIAFAAPGHNGAHQAPAATLTAQGYQFTVTGLNPGTAYDYSVTATDASGKTLAEHKGNFSTTGGTGFESVHDSQCTMHKYFHNGNLIIERNGVKYTPAGQKVQ